MNNISTVQDFSDLIWKVGRVVRPLTPFEPCAGLKLVFRTLQIYGSFETMFNRNTSLLLQVRYQWYTGSILVVTHRPGLTRNLICIFGMDYCRLDNSDTREVSWLSYGDPGLVTRCMVPGVAAPCDYPHCSDGSYSVRRYSFVGGCTQSA